MKKTIIRAEITDKKQLAQALELEELQYIYAPERLLDEATPSKDRIIVVPNIFLGDCEDKTLNRLRELKKYGYNRALAHTVGHIELINNADMVVHGGMRLNITNSLSADFFAEQGLIDIIASCELTAGKIRALKCSVPVGVMGYGRLPLMVTRRCPIKDGKLCDNGKSCGKYLTDRQGKRIYTVCFNAVELLNPDVLTIADKKEDFPTAAFFVLKFTVESNIISAVNDFIKGKKPEKEFTRGLYYRGVE